MRITLTLDEDVYRKLVSETCWTGRSFREVVNEHLRRSLVAAKPAERRNPFWVNARSMGLRPGVEVEYRAVARQVRPSCPAMRSALSTNGVSLLTVLSSRSVPKSS